MASPAKNKGGRPKGARTGAKDPFSLDQCNRIARQLLKHLGEEIDRQAQQPGALVFAGTKAAKKHGLDAYDVAAADLYLRVYEQQQHAADKAGEQERQDKALLLAVLADKHKLKGVVPPETLKALIERLLKPSTARG